MIPVVRRSGRIVVPLVAGTVILTTAAAVLAAVVVPRAAGATPYTILTGSMRPHLPPGTLVVMRPVRAEQVGVGTVITYQRESGRSEVVTHRVVEVSQGPDGEPRWHTRGDANPASDPDWVRPVQLRGELWYAVPFLGHLNVLLDQRQRRLLESAVALLLLAYAAVRFAGAVAERRRPEPEVAR